jgi:hypothetical protein
MNIAPKTAARQSQGRAWFATFTFVDVGCAIDSRQLEGILRSLATLWRGTFGRLR